MLMETNGEMLGPLITSGTNDCHSIDSVNLGPFFFGVLP